jgi:hypothetical protein
MARQLFWAMMTKLTPARRVLWLVALALLLILGFNNGAESRMIHLWPLSTEIGETARERRIVGLAQVSVNTKISNY